MVPSPSPVMCPISAARTLRRGQRGGQRLQHSGGNGHEQSARGLGVAENQLIALVEAGEPDAWLQVLVVARRPAGDRPPPHQGMGFVQDGDGPVGHPGHHSAACGHLVQVAEQAEPGDVRRRVDADLDHGVGGITVEPLHLADGGFRGRRRRFLLFDPRGDDADAQRFRQDEPVPGLSADVAHDPVGTHQPRDGQAVLGLRIVDAVAARDEDPGLPGLVRAPLQDLLQDGQRQLPAREADDVQGEDRPAAHGIDVGQRVRRGDRPVVVRVVHDGREDVHGLDEGEVVGEAVDRRVVDGARPHQEVRVAGNRQPAQDLRQVLRTEFGCSPRAGDHRGEPDALPCRHAPHPLSGTDITRRL